MFSERPSPVERISNLVLASLGQNGLGQRSFELIKGTEKPADVLVLGVYSLNMRTCPLCRNAYTWGSSDMLAYPNDSVAVFDPSFLLRRNFCLSALPRSACALCQTRRF